MPTNCTQATAPRLCSIHQHRRAANRLRAPLARRPLPYAWLAERAPARRDEILTYWTRRHRHAAAEFRYMHGQPSRSACYALVARRFADLNAPLALAIVNRESGCYWAAQNPTSTATGAWQFLDTWGSLQQRLDVVWSTNRAYHAVQTSGWSPWYPLP